MKLYVGNLSFDTTENDLQDLFEQHGKVTDVALINDRATGRSRGFGFVTMSDAAAGTAAIEAFNGKEVQGRTLTVNEARAREERPRQFTDSRR
jgi:RNA recognition motif-containing protein